MGFLIKPKILLERLILFLEGKGVGWQAMYFCIIPAILESWETHLQRRRGFVILVNQHAALLPHHHHGHISPLHLYRFRGWHVSRTGFDSTHRAGIKGPVVGEEPEKWNRIRRCQSTVVGAE